MAHMLTNLTFTMLNLNVPVLEKSVDPDRLASDLIHTVSTVLVIEYILITGILQL